MKILKLLSELAQILLFFSLCIICAVMTFLVGALAAILVPLALATQEIAELKRKSVPCLSKNEEPP